MKKLIEKYLSDNECSGELGKDYLLQDNGNGIFISYWNENIIGISKPEFTEQELSDGEVQEKIEYQLQQLNSYHFNSSEIREMKINDYFILSLSGDGRALIAEQIQSLEQQIKLNVITEESATFEYFYNGGSIEITLVQLRQLYIFMLNVVNTNYGVYKAHIHAIKNLSTIEEVESYDFTANYLKNQNLNIE
jgi:hypothetical protein